MAIKNNIPPPLNLKKTLPCFSQTFLAVRAYINQGNKMRLVSLFFTPISHFLPFPPSSLFPFSPIIPSKFFPGY